MDTAYSAAAIEDNNRRLGHSPILVGGSDQHAPGCRAEQRAERKRLRRLGFKTVETRIAGFRSAAERIADRLKSGPKDHSIPEARFRAEAYPLLPPSTTYIGEAEHGGQHAVATQGRVISFRAD